MKKLSLTLLAVLTGLLGLAYTLPYFFKDQIQEQVNKAIIKQVKGKVYYSDLNLSLFRHFPYLAINIEDFGIVGLAPFSQDTLAQAKGFELSFDVMSLIKGQKIIQNIRLEQPKIYLKILKNGQANYDIFVPSKDTGTTSGKPSEGVQLQIQNWQIVKGTILYKDLQKDSEILLTDIEHNGSGDINKQIFDLATNTEINQASVVWEGKNYFSQRKLAWQSLIQVNQSAKSYSFQDTRIRLNDFELSFSGKIQQQDSTYTMDVAFQTPETNFKNLVSLVPMIYQNQFDALKAEGDIQCTGQVKGLYASQSIPSFHLNVQVKNGSFQYPSLPTGVSQVWVDCDINNTSNQLDSTQITLNRFDLYFGKNPIKAKAKIKGLSRSIVDADVKGEFQLEELTKLFPIEGTQLKGRFGVDLHSKGTYDSLTGQFPVTNAQMLLENGYILSKQFAKPIEDIHFKANLTNQDGTLKNSLLAIQEATFHVLDETFQAKGSVQDFDAFKWDITAKGKLDLTQITKIFPVENTTLKGKIDADIRTQGNLKDLKAKRYGSLNTNGQMAVSNFEYRSKELPQGIKIDQGQAKLSPNSLTITQSKGYLGSSDFEATGTMNNYMAYALTNDVLKGNFQVKSNHFNVNEWMSSEPKATTSGQAPNPNVHPSVVEVPKNLQLSLNTQANEIVYDKMAMNNAKGVIRINNGTIRLENTNFDALGGRFATTGSYDPSDIAHPKFDFGLNLEKVNFTEAYQHLSVVKYLMPLAQFMVGEVSSQFKINGELTQDMMPNFATLNGSGLLKLLKASLQNSPLIEKLVANTKLTQLKDLQLNNALMQVQIDHGTLKIKPFTVKWNDYAVNIGGQHSIVGDMDYKLAFDIPSGKAGQSFNNLFTQWTGKALNNVPRVKFDLSLIGTLKSPIVRFDNSSTAQNLKDAVTSEIKSQIDNAKNQAVQQAEDLLKAEKEKLLKEAQDKLKTGQGDIQAQAKATADSLKKVALERAKKLLESQKKGVLDGIFKKPQPAKKDSTK